MTGGRGFIGSALVRRLGAEILDLPDDITKTNLDFRGVDVVFHLAARTSVQDSLQDPIEDAQTNIIGSLRVIEAARRSGSRIVYAASGGTMEDLRSPYGVSKRVVLDYLNLLGSPWVALALENVYGPGGHGVISDMLAAHERGEPLRINGDGNQTRDFVWIDDVVEAFSLAAHRGSGVIGIGTGVPTSLEELARMVGGPVRHDPALAGETRHTVADLQMAKEQLRWDPTVTLEEGLSWMRSRRSPTTTHTSQRSGTSSIRYDGASSPSIRQTS